jgi:hypothetical protein
LKNVPSGVSAFEIQMVFALSPMLHLVLPSSFIPNTELIMGPKFGYWFGDLESSSTLAGSKVTFSQSVVGFALGLNLGAFYGLGDSMSVGGLFNFDLRLVSTCSDNSTGTGAVGSGTCSAGPSLKVFGFSLAALF